jgi:uncharacterized membrane protein required for colicin V production
MIIDIIVILFILLSIFRGYSKGLVGILVSLIGFVVAIILAFTLQSTVANYLNEKTQVGSTIEGIVKDSITNQIEQKANSTNQQSQDSVESKIKNDFYTQIVSKIANSSEIDSAAKNVTMFILKGISFIGIFMIVIIISYILQMLLNIVFTLPILGGINKIGGLAISVVLAIVKVWVVLGILSFIVPIVSSNFLDNILSGSVLTRYLFDNNILVSLLSSNLKK